MRTREAGVEEHGGGVFRGSRQSQAKEGKDGFSSINRGGNYDTFPTDPQQEKD